jgi:hypothetical protein
MSVSKDARTIVYSTTVKYGVGSKQICWLLKINNDTKLEYFIALYVMPTYLFTI